MIKYSLNLKLFFFINILFIYLVICLSAFGENLNLSNEQIVLGANKAPVKIKIFSSLTCPHCANFHTRVLPKIKEKYVDKGKVQLIFIDFPLDQAGFNASKLLHCLNKKKQMAFLDKIYEDQNKWTNETNLIDINKNLKKIVENLGINQTKFDKCLNDEAIADKILNGRIEGQNKYSINSTPTIIINEKKFEGSTNFESIEKKIEKLI